MQIDAGTPGEQNTTMRRFWILAAFVLISLPAHSQWVYTALGASDAVGVGASPETNGYVYLIGNWLDNRYTPWELRNRGVSGYTATQIRDTTLVPALNDRPRIVTLWVGGNDIKNSVQLGEATSVLEARYRDAFTTIIRRLSLESPAFIVTATIPDLSRVPAALIFTQQQRDMARDGTLAVNAIIRDVASQYQVPVADLYSDPDSYSWSNYSWDGFHPNNTGYAKMATHFETILQDRAWRIVSGLGDPTGDGGLTPTDAGAVLRISAGINTATDRQAVAADVFPAGGDGRIDVLDSVTMMRRIFGFVPDAQWR